MLGVLVGQWLKVSCDGEEECYSTSSVSQATKMGDEGTSCKAELEGADG